MVQSIIFHMSQLGRLGLELRSSSPAQTFPFKLLPFAIVTGTRIHSCSSMVDAPAISVALRGGSPDRNNRSGYILVMDQLPISKFLLLFILFNQTMFLFDLKVRIAAH